MVLTAEGCCENGELNKKIGSAAKTSVKNTNHCTDGTSERQEGKGEAQKPLGRVRFNINKLVGKIPLRRKWQHALGFLPGKFRGQRSLPGYSPRGCKRIGCDLATRQQQTHIKLLVVHVVGPQ